MSSPPPTHFRIIYGLSEQTNNLKFIVAGLDSYKNENTNSIYVINNPAHCHVLCDINSSSIILGSRRGACR
ncbi:MAG: hypothetical protein IT215_02240 [Chitinophagaceae bacterium]|nr:MAG: hypothetical protein UZ11_BCD004001373 [Bacteroidetes bacterium OLB11]MCC6447490.1 hypothetical protein [Chitinophagaceae bacterium]HMN33208.1 hypothetical protein [Chitinophagaceae bacterium]